MLYFHNVLFVSKRYLFESEYAIKHNIIYITSKVVYMRCCSLSVVGVKSALRGYPKHCPRPDKIAKSITFIQGQLYLYLFVFHSQ